MLQALWNIFHQDTSVQYGSFSVAASFPLAPTCSVFGPCQDLNGLEQ